MSMTRPLIAGVLSPAERVSEILFGLIMTLSITGTMSVAAGGEEEVGTMLWGVIGCNVAWGIIDGILYLIGSGYERGRGHVLHEFIRAGGAVEEARAAIELIMQNKAFGEAGDQVVIEVFLTGEAPSLPSPMAKPSSPSQHPKTTRPFTMAIRGPILAE